MRAFAPFLFAAATLLAFPALASGCGGDDVNAGGSDAAATDAGGGRDASGGIDAGADAPAAVDSGQDAPGPVDAGNADTGGGTDAGADGGSGLDAGNAHVVMVGQGGLVYAPNNLTINAGETVLWVWAASGHSVTSGTSCSFDGKFDSGVQAAGFQFPQTFNAKGTFPYYCSVHCLSGMTGTITVQ